MKSSKLVRRFNIGKSALSDKEKLVLFKLEKAAEGIATIYEMQINDRFPGANFYPHDATSEEILSEAKHNPLILNPYTVVERDRFGNLNSIPYHVKYADKLKPVISLIREAAGFTDNKEFSKRLEVQADALENGSYEAADIYWLTMKPYKIDIIIGPSERYEDRLFFKKTCYSATVGIVDEGATSGAESIRDAILSSHRKAFSLSQKIETTDRLQVRIDRVSILAGLDARALFAGAFLPNDPNLIEKYGSEVIIFATAVKQNFKDIHFPIFKKVFANLFQKSYDPDILLDGSQKLLLIREISTSLVKYRDAESRLGQYYPIIYEMASYVLAVKNAGFLLLKDLIPQKKLEAMIIMLVCRAFASFINSKNVKSLTHYSQGYAIAINYLMQSGGLKELKGISWVNFTKIFVALSELAATLDRILAFGSLDDAKRLIDEYGDSKNCLKLISRI